MQRITKASYAVATSALVMGTMGCGGSSNVSKSTPVSFTITLASTSFPATLTPSGSYWNIPQGRPSANFHASPPASQFAIDGWNLDGTNGYHSGTYTLADGTIAIIKDATLSLKNVQGNHIFVPELTNTELVTMGLWGFPSGPESIQPMWCSSDGSYALVGARATWPMGGALFQETDPATGYYQLQKYAPSATGIFGLNRNGWLLYQYQDSSGTGIGLLDAVGITHVIAPSPQSYGQYALNDAGTVLFDLTPPSIGSATAQFYTQNGADSSSRQPIPADVDPFLMNDSGIVVGLSYGLNSIQKGMIVVVIEGQEVSLPNVQGTLAALGNDGTLATVPSPGVVNVYGKNGQQFLTQIQKFQIDTVNGPNAFNRLIGHNLAGDTKIVGQSTAPQTQRQWGYWDLKQNKFVPVSEVTGFSSVERIWCISDSDQIFATEYVTVNGGKWREPVAWQGFTDTVFQIYPPYGFQTSLPIRHFY